ncbi:hypothetical protein KCP71_25730 [Salmonella enterica subsp. enterica]|nr:hypothetical protein KCP71_25730 [Salmonella enterica subsp. enterica]
MSTIWRWRYLRHIEGLPACAGRHHAFCSTLENMGVRVFINAIMTLIAFLPVLVTLSAHVPGTHRRAYPLAALVIAAIVTGHC